ncbi:DNA endonuclease SmrA [Porticoccaceae bacterium]|jgi:DNA-nicking Smr family endonuclease|nr:DNA endonuclease SmrA [Porticoccaceae bacterium]MDA8885522.1 DNA endonuclease SmrA [Porticoccaceae bacterium]MDA8903569.1 DNA endonuclease SmrA [Porticoccaceae bacterium]MDA8920066.1 DNA endonuclease SmrA [Porticoccaceae bacterium]MDB2319440.1 DNA endonuclease SmrA [Porticoccaceae bacterium]
MSAAEYPDSQTQDPADEDEFRALVGDDVEPLQAKGARYIPKPPELTPGILERRKAAQQEQLKSGNLLDPASIINVVDPYDFLEFARPGVQHGVYKNLRQGKYEVQSRLDLHRHTVEQARVALWDFVEGCQKHGVRCALVTHGKGEGREQPARLKSCVNHWLRQIDNVLAFHSAQKQHGGVGSTYILIKKNSLARLSTSEKLGKSKRS